MVAIISIAKQGNISHWFGLHFPGTSYIFVRLGKQKCCFSKLHISLYMPTNPYFSVFLKISVFITASHKSL